MKLFVRRLQIFLHIFHDFSFQLSPLAFFFSYPREQPETWRLLFRFSSRKLLYFSPPENGKRIKAENLNFKFVIILVSYSKLAAEASAIVIEKARKFILCASRQWWNKREGESRGEKVSKFLCHEVAYKINLNGFFSFSFHSPW